MLPFALVRLSLRPGAHWGSQYQVGAAIFLSASKAREKTRSHREHGILLQIPPRWQRHREMQIFGTAYSNRQFCRHLENIRI
jgi:hypothetical protein